MHHEVHLPGWTSKLCNGFHSRKKKEGVGMTWKKSYRLALRKVMVWPQYGFHHLSLSCTMYTSFLGSNKLGTLTIGYRVIIH